MAQKHQWWTQFSFADCSVQRRTELTLTESFLHRHYYCAMFSSLAIKIIIPFSTKNLIRPVILNHPFTPVLLQLLIRTFSKHLYVGGCVLHNESTFINTFRVFWQLTIILMSIQTNYTYLFPTKKKKKKPT